MRGLEVPGQLQNVKRKLSRYEKLKEKCGGIVEEQIRTAVIEKAPKQSAVTTKVCMVFKPQGQTPSCREPLCNVTWRSKGHNLNIQ